MTSTGENETLIRLEFSPDFASELEVFVIHPALMDVATISIVQESLARSLRQNQSSGSAVQQPGVYVPIGYKSLKIFSPLQSTVYCYAQHSQTQLSGEFISSDVLIMDEAGTTLMEVRGFTTRRVQQLDPLPGTKASDTPGTTAANTAGSAGNSFSDNADRHADIERGILTREGLQAFDLILCGNTLPQIVVCTEDLEMLLETAASYTQQRILQGLQELQGTHLSERRADLSSPYAAPQNELESAIAKIWETSFNIEKIGINDNFFELGGHSLLAIQILSQIRKALSVDLALASVFEAPTIAGMADAIAAKLGQQIEAASMLELLHELDRPGDEKALDAQK